MKKLLFTLLTIVCIYKVSVAQSPVIVNKDSEIAGMVAEVSADSMKNYINKLVSFGTRNTLSSTTDAQRGIGAARNWILSRFKSFAATSGGRFTAKFDTSTYKPDGKRIDSTVVLTNVVGTLKGADPNDHRVFIISGHMDNMRSSVMDRSGIAPGANDDGSGTAAVIECARIMSKHKFPATIIFVAVCGEEQGLLGAGFMAANAKRDKWDIQAVLNNDIIGSNNSNETNIIGNTRVRVFSEGLSAFELTEQKAAAIRAMGLENDGPSRQLARYVKEVGERYVDNLDVVMIYRPDRFLRGGDHLPYQQQGYAAVRITEMNENFNHQHQDVRVEKGIQYGDLAEFMDFEYLRKNTAMNLSNLANMAKAPQSPQDVNIAVVALSNLTELSWKAPAGKAAGYYVLMRETTSPVWQKKIFTADTSMKLPYSKDNYFFAVQSVSATGNESLPVVPAVSRKR
ncbi:M20/M25/M40 family metallo-hydrolase [Mucilaginibacter sp. JRF]|uniref:M20/M25/M40 family metallo-hydrolase n=1 Tax=Mucilaginibacter sp. JRF TaxID=2780088 RepID=UPI0018819284|nr:M20/M25/M40 family metallo-hydrolase [Mucilaginibacter sp. JRF]MBE9585821.1 M20/M25/M40 family metallo-hydrolase [Mucilaginibacter sp. JRF]